MPASPPATVSRFLVNDATERDTAGSTPAASRSVVNGATERDTERYGLRWI